MGTDITKQGDNMSEHMENTLVRLYGENWWDSTDQNERA